MYRNSRRNKDKSSEKFSPSPNLLIDLDKEDAQSLPGFIKLAWHILEPGRTFIPNWHIDAISDHLTGITKGHLNRLIINIPPGCMKSLLTSVFWPVWEWGPQNRPHLRYVTFSYSEDLTIRDSRKVMQLITHPWFQQRWPHCLMSKDQKAKHRFDTTATGFRVATSVTGLGTGERGDRVIIDDPHNVRTGESEAIRSSTIQWLRETVPTRVNDAESSAIIMIMQRVHEYDATGFITSNELGWTHLCLPMEYDPSRHCTTIIGPKTFSDPRTEENELLWPASKTRATVERDKLIMGEYAIAGQYQQNPTPRGGGMIKEEWLQPIAYDSPLLSRIKTTVRAWDLAATVTNQSDWTVGAKLAITTDGKIIILDIKRERLTPSGVDEFITSTAIIDTSSTFIRLPQDPGQAGVSQKAHLAAHLIGYNFKFVRETGDKELRLRPFASQAEAGNVFLLCGTWNGALIDELSKFPHSRYDDQADAISSAFDQLIPRKRPLSTPGKPRTIQLVESHHHAA